MFNLAPATHQLRERRSIFGFKMAEYWRQVNPLILHRSAVAPAAARGAVSISQYWRVLARDVIIRK
jgi:hypothetical protein